MSLRLLNKSPFLRFPRYYCTKPEPTTSTSITNFTIAKKQKLYIIDEISPGSIFFLPHGTRILNKLIKFMKFQQRNHGFEEVMTPLIYKKQLWEKSGHWLNYKDDMFQVQGTDTGKEEYGLKPMNCPGHCLIFDRFDRSYQELPIRLSDFSSLHRNESSGSLSGLTRVRRFHQDDGHIFCSQDQIKQEIQSTLELIDKVYKKFDILDYKLFLSTRPEEYMGKLEEWDLAEESLREVLESTGAPWEINEGDGAFYGPKIDIILKDSTGKEHQSATIQLDFQLPHNFQLKYKTNENGVLEQPIMIHRAVYGSLERFLAILIDHYQGKWPFWLSPRQAVIIPINESHISYAETMAKEINNEGEEENLNDYKFFLELDKRNETVGQRIKEAITQGYNYIIIIGDKEVKSGELAIRSSGSKKLQVMKSGEIRDFFIDLEKSYK
ncbi:hypothetical protein BN7_9 [Wickerhamomyces ciferrii]|uniref:threonine--tRNA ligase n=1 Tax=Wickerhamomyces ciferrii (strain ATCC 14091 / BCRC 22168 / CBS 111 / JCM 3599 / NBRC 0793 / NRRL Y-1031 F-60-10) TaxID=1206466 RepID=K0KC57_WICCF|nr:uncharacterized protein BN7_9 [Wickerhamomyces ciferrii]CCH40476.1 hypothetical protein BN7_9 [Wickerhamomyces ciferrii]